MLMIATQTLFSVSVLIDSPAAGFPVVSLTQVDEKVGGRDILAVHDHVVGHIFEIGGHGTTQARVPIACCALAVFATPSSKTAAAKTAIELFVDTNT
jgi:hypothetical protein